MKQKFLDVVLQPVQVSDPGEKENKPSDPEKCPSSPPESLQTGHRKWKPKQSPAFSLGEGESFRAGGGQGEENALAKHQRGNWAERKLWRSAGASVESLTEHYRVLRVEGNLQGCRRNTKEEEVDQAGELSQGQK